VLLSRRAASLVATAIVQGAALYHSHVHLSNFRLGRDPMCRRATRIADDTRAHVAVQGHLALYKSPAVRLGEETATTAIGCHDGEDDG
jgi:hypothetical protein